MSVDSYYGSTWEPRDPRRYVRHLRAIPRASVAGTVDQITSAGAYPYVNATPDVIVLPDNLKATTGPSTFAMIFDAPWARAGTGTLGQLANINTQTPGALQLSVSYSGDILVNAASAWTSLDVIYLPAFQDIVSGTYVCDPSTGIVSGLPAGLISILEAEVMVGGATGKKIVNVPAASAPSAGNASLTLGKTGIFFATADAPTSVRLKLGVIPAYDNA